MIEHGPTRRELRRSRTLVIATLLAASGCAHAITATGQRSESVGVGAAVFTIRYSPADLDAARQVRRALRDAARGDPLSDAAPLYRTDAVRVYRTADGAFRFLVQTDGDERITALLDTLRDGIAFPEASRNVIGVSVDGFLTQFKNQGRG